MGCLRSLVQLRLLAQTLFGRYWRIIINGTKVIGYVFKLIFVSVNYLAALILLPLVVFYMTHLITKDYLIPTIVAAATVAIYLVLMSNYFSKGMHQFGVNAKEIKQLSHSIRVEHKIALRSLREDKLSGSLFVILTILILVEFIFFYNLLTRFGAGIKIRNVILFFILCQIAVLLMEYSKAGHKLFRFRLPKFKFKKKKEKDKEKTDKDDEESKEKKDEKIKEKEEPKYPLPSNYKKSESFDDLIIEAGPEEE